MSILEEINHLRPLQVGKVAKLYNDFICSKSQIEGDHGFEPLKLRDDLFPFQKAMVEWSLKKGRSAIFADCGLGKTLMQLSWAENVAMHTGERVLVLTPLAVSYQTVLEAEKFGIDAAIGREGHPAKAQITITNYEQLYKFNPSDFGGCVCDESSILKNYDGVLKCSITEFMRLMKYRLLCTATAAPNDFTELGTSSEALGYLGHTDMLSKFFRVDNNTAVRQSNTARFGKFRFRGHSEMDFWRWVCSWAKAIRTPSDAGFSDDGFDLPDLITNQHLVKADNRRDGYLFDLPVSGLQEEREERSRTLQERVDRAAAIINVRSDVSVAWCHLNKESECLRKSITDAVEIKGSDSDTRKEQVFRDFSEGNIKCLVTKPSIAGFGMNWQHSNHMTFFPSHSFEQYYQAVRRCWRFGQKHPVTVDIIASEGELNVLNNLKRKAALAEDMFSRLIELMNQGRAVEIDRNFNHQLDIPTWL